MQAFLESRKAFWLIFALCLGARVYLFFNSFLIARDAVTYAAMARAFLGGDLSEAVQHITPPLYPLLMGFGKQILGDYEAAGKIVSLLAGTLTFFPLYWLGQRIFDRKTLLAGLFFFSVHPYLVRYSVEVLSESTFIFFSVLGLWLLWEGWQENRYGSLSLAGVFLGLSCLTRAQGFIWIGVLVILPILFSLQGQRIEIDKRGLWMPSLIVLFFFFVTISPYACVVKQVTGEWTVRPGGAGAIVKGTGLLGNESILGTTMTLLGHPWMLLKKLLLNLALFVWFLPATYHYPLVFFLAIGLLAKRDEKTHLPGEVFLGVVCLVYILGHSLLYPKVRYLLPIVPFALLWSGRGLPVTASHIRAFCKRRLPGIRFAGSSPFALVILLCLAAAVTLPKTLKPQRQDKLDRKEVGKKIASLSQRDFDILTADPRIGFYANAAKIRVLPEVGSYEELMEYVQRKSVDFIVMDRTLTTDPIWGDLITTFFERPKHEELELLFAYPSEDRQEPPRFEVYRLLSQEHR
jgi:4-amino-4-deoxy-L-arabinose transferase-like glycosyltransferase